MVSKHVARTWLFKWSFDSVDRKGIGRCMNSVMVTQLSKRISPFAVLDTQISFCVKLVTNRKKLHIKTGKYIHEA